MSLQMKLCYSPLPSFSLHARNNFPAVTKDSGEMWTCLGHVGVVTCCDLCAVCGVLCVHVHSGHELLSADGDGFSDPYCVVKVNKEKVNGHRREQLLIPDHYLKADCEWSMRTCNCTFLIVSLIQILRTHHIGNSLSPCWERGVEVFVSDITQVCMQMHCLGLV